MFFAEKALPRPIAWLGGPLLRWLFMRFARRTTASALGALTRNRELIAVLTGQWGDYGLPPGQQLWHSCHHRPPLFRGRGISSRWRVAIAAGIAPLIEKAGGGIVVGAEVARIFGLETRLDTVSQLLSQGEKKLLDVASAFALNPEVILLDEPTSGISTAEKHGIMQTLLAAAERAGVKALILVEHDMDLVAAYSTRIVAIAEGRLLADLPPQLFFENAAVIEIVVGKRRHG